jgi:hypothetical protein
MTVKSISRKCSYIKKEASNLAKEKKYDEAITLFLKVLLI